MANSLFSRLTRNKKKQAETLPPPDVSRVTGATSETESASPRRTKRRPVAQQDSVDIDIWLNADLERLSSTWAVCLEGPEDKSALTAFNRAIHNLHGASGAYGGGALTRLSGSLQDLMQRTDQVTEEAALINLHVQACRAAGLGGENSSEDIASAVCDALEAQVKKSTSAACPDIPS